MTGGGTAVTANGTGETGIADEPVSLRRWLWLAYLKSAIVPLLVIELSFLAIFITSNVIVYQTNVRALRVAAQSYLDSVARNEGATIATGLNGIQYRTDLLARQVKRALDGNYMPPAEERARYGVSDGHIYTRYDNGTTASFYPPDRKTGQHDYGEIWKLSAVDTIMMDLEQTSPLVQSVYVNTAKNYNRIYPYFDVLAQYPRNMDIVDYNFYYLADGKHNPKRVPVWTPAYVDPAGHGWMISSIAPVWRGNRLEAVVGQDVTLDIVVDNLNRLELPWNGFAMLVDDKGSIIAMPPAAEKALGLKEVTGHVYTSAITADTGKPEEFSLGARADTADLAAAMNRAESGRVELPLNGGAMASFTRIPGPDWRLVVVAPNSGVFAQANRVRDRLQLVGWAMAGVLIVFYALFFYHLHRRSVAMSNGLVEPIGHLSTLLGQIGAGDYTQNFVATRIREINELGRQLVATGARLGSAHRTIVSQEETVQRAYRRERQVNEEQTRFLRVVSHEIRTPLAVIDSGAQILERKADDIDPDQVRARALRFRTAVDRISQLLLKLNSSFTVTRDDGGADGAVPVALTDTITRLVHDLVPPQRRDMRMQAGEVMIAQAAVFGIALRTVLDNAVRYSPDTSPVTVTADVMDGYAVVRVADQGDGVPLDEQGLLGDRFFRGRNAANEEGAGVGLYVARRIVENAGARMEIDSSGAGTVVTLHWQILREPVLAVAAEGGNG